MLACLWIFMASSTIGVTWRGINLVYLCILPLDRGVLMPIGKVEESYSYLIRKRNEGNWRMRGREVVVIT